MKEDRKESKDFPRNLENTSLYISLTKTVSGESDAIKDFLSLSFSFAYFCEVNSLTQTGFLHVIVVKKSVARSKKGSV